MQLAVVGSTNLTQHQFGVAYPIIYGFAEYYRPNYIVSGGAVGIDSVATLVANELNIRMIEHLPKHKRWEPDGFKDRNMKIAEDCSFLLCIRSSQSTTYGSGWTADRAEEMGKPVWRVTI